MVDAFENVWYYILLVLIVILVVFVSVFATSKDLVWHVEWLLLLLGHKVTFLLWKYSEYWISYVIASQNTCVRVQGEDWQCCWPLLLVILNCFQGEFFRMLNEKELFLCFQQCFDRLDKMPGIPPWIDTHLGPSPYSISHKYYIFGDKYGILASLPDFLGMRCKGKGQFEVILLLVHFDIRWKYFLATISWIIHGYAV